MSEATTNLAEVRELVNESKALVKDAYGDIADAKSQLQALKELLAEHQELGRLQGNRMDELARELGETQAKLRAAQTEIQRLTTALNARRAGT